MIGVSYFIHLRRWLARSETAGREPRSGPDFLNS